MKGNKRKADSTLPLDGGEATLAEDPVVNEGEEESADAGGEEQEEEEDGEEEEEEEAPKLDEGFYEIEDIRKKRVRKGQLQYLIKWRGWPETANTWEPLDNVQSCADMIEAFEERLRSNKSSRKRKRRYGGPHTLVKKKRSGGSTRSEESPAVPPPPNGNPHYSSGPLPSQGHHGGETEGFNAERDREEVDGCSGKELVDGKKTVEELKANGSSDPLENDHQKDSNNGVATNFTKETGPSCTERAAMGHISIQLHGDNLREEDGSMDDGSSKAECIQPLQGAKKRKSGSVRRFKQDSPQDEAHNAAVRVGGSESCSKAEKLGTEDVDSTEDDIGDRHKIDYSANPPSITKILKPVRYYASVTDNVQQVSITFKALRSDGIEVLVDDKDLKINNPLLLISYYEQHLRYSPHS